MQINPGGAIALAQIVGRDKLVSQLTAQLKAQSLVLVAERRVGKTHVLRKLERQRTEDQIIIYRDLESIHTADEFVSRVFEDIAKHHGTLDRFTDLINKFRKGVAGTDIKIMGSGVKLPDVPIKHWKQILQEGIGQTVEALADKQLILLWDELPLMLQNIAGTSGAQGSTKGNPEQAMELLNVLRELRQHHPQSLRMVYTGSIGLHHVVNALKAKGYPNAPSNDMLTEEVPPLDMASAADLANELLRTNNMNATGTETLEDIAQHMANKVDGVAFYVHHVVSALNKKDERLVSKAIIDQVLLDAVQADNHDTWELAHYRDRTQTYYGAEQSQGLALLDAIASGGNGLSVAQSIQSAKSNHPTVGHDVWLRLIELLQRDFYVVRDKATGDLRFKFKLVLEWWRWHRHITVQQGVSHV